MVRRLTEAELDAQIRTARRAGREAERQPWWPVGVHYERSGNRVVVELRDGTALGIPLTALPELQCATVRQLEAIELSGEALRVDELDIDISVAGLLSEWLGPRFSTVAAGRIGGKSRSRAKAAAARANGRKGGRPRS